MGVKNHWLELSLAIIVILLAAGTTFFGVDKSLAWIVGICTALIAASVAIIKNHQETVVENKKNEILSFLDPSIKILSHISKMEGMPRVIALEILKETCEKLENISKGIIRLDQSTYYADIEECMKTATPGSEVQAINSLDSLRWSKNPRQARYLEANKKAASRGVKIHRIFVLRKSSLNDEGAEKKIENIREQLLQPGIEVDVVWLEQLNGFGLIEDWVYFSHPEPKLYVDYADQADRTQVVYADLYIVNNDIERKKGGFRKLIAHAIDEKERNSVFLKGVEINNEG